MRIVSNPAFSSHAVSVREAIQVLAASLRHPSHRFWVDDAGLLEVTADLHDRLAGHQQVTDAYLLGLAMRRKGKLADAGPVHSVARSRTLGSPGADRDLGWQLAFGVESRTRYATAKCKAKVGEATADNGRP